MRDRRGRHARCGRRGGGRFREIEGWNSLGRWRWRGCPGRGRRGRWRRGGWLWWCGRRLGR